MTAGGGIILSFFFFSIFFLLGSIERVYFLQPNEFFCIACFFFFFLILIFGHDFWLWWMSCSFIAVFLFFCFIRPVFSSCYHYYSPLGVAAEMSAMP